MFVNCPSVVHLDPAYARIILCPVLCLVFCTWHPAKIRFGIYELRAALAGQVISLEGKLNGLKGVTPILSRVITPVISSY